MNIIPHTQGRRQSDYLSRILDEYNVAELECEFLNSSLPCAIHQVYEEQMQFPKIGGKPE